MKHKRDIQKLRHYAFLSQTVALLIFFFGVLSIILFFNPDLIGIPQEQEYYQGQWVWLLTGLGFLIFAIFCGIFARRRTQRLIWVLNNVQPELMTLTIEIKHWSDSTDYYGILTGLEKGLFWKVSLYNPSWNVEALAGAEVPVTVYFDPQRKKPAVVETEHGLLWIGAAYKNSFTSRPR